MTVRRTFYGIQILRGVAASLVVCYHVGSTLGGHDGPGGFRSVPVFFLGNGGVDLFFVISGFVIAWTTKDQWRREDGWRVFLKKRISRIVPLYWLLTTGKLALILSMPQLFRGAPPTGADIVASYLLLPAWDASGQISLILVAGWTLCFEMAFYYVATICLALHRRPALYATPMLVAFGLLGVVRTPGWGALASLVDPLLLEFVAGMWIAELAGSGKVHGRPFAMLMLLAAGLGLWLASALLPAQTAFAGRTLVWGIPAALILYAAVALESAFDFGRLRLALLLGEASYSIYLGHVFVLQPLLGRARELNLPPVGEWAVFVGLVATGLGFGVLVWWTLERKLIRGAITTIGERWKRSDPPASAASRR